jgi:SMC interacting uncharacterized protein involved in chromosome segregation
MELILCCDKLDAQEDLQEPMDDVILSERIFFDYLKKAYSTFLDEGKEHDTEMEKELIKSFGKKNFMKKKLFDLLELDVKNELVIKDIERLKKDMASMEKEWNQLTSQDVIYFLF